MSQIIRRTVVGLVVGLCLLTPLASAAPRLRSVLARHVRMKHLPELRFREDPSVAGGQRIDSLLRELHSDDDPVDDTPDRRRNKDRR